MDTKMKAWETNKEAQAGEVFDRAMGIRENQALTRADIPGIVSSVRKAMLEKTEKERAPAMEKATPDGNKTPDPFDKLFSLEEAKS